MSSILYLIVFFMLMLVGVYFMIFGKKYGLKPNDRLAIGVLIFFMVVPLCALFFI